MPPYRQRVVAPPARPAGRFARGAAPPLWQSAGFGSVGCPPPPCAPCAASARLGLALAAPPFSAGAWLRGGSRRGNWDSAACGRRGKDTPLGFPAHTLPYRCRKLTTLSTVSIRTTRKTGGSDFFKTVQTRRQDGLPPFRDGGFRAWCTPVRGHSPPSPWCRPSGDGWRRRRLQSPAYPASAPPWRCGSRRWIPP